MPDNPIDRCIENLRIFSTGTGALHPEHRNGSRKPQLWWVLTSKSWIKVPLNAFLIEHRDGLVLFDTGIDPTIKSDPSYIDSAIGRFLLKRIFQLDLGPNDGLDQQLMSLGHRAADIQKAVISHLHFDHVGGIAHIPQAELLVSRNEWAQLSSPHPEREWILREHIELPSANWRPIDFVSTNDPVLSPFGGCYDVMGDGSIVLLPTPGHTPGSLSALLRSEGMAPVLLIGDLSYDVDMLMNDQLPGTGNGEQLRQSFAKVRALKEQLPNLIIIATHDQAAKVKLKAAKAPSP